MTSSCQSVHGNMGAAYFAITSCSLRVGSGDATGLCMCVCESVCALQPAVAAYKDLDKGSATEHQEEQVRTEVALPGVLNSLTSSCRTAAAVEPSMRALRRPAPRVSCSATSSMRVLVDTMTAFSPSATISGSMRCRQTSLLDALGSMAGGAAAVVLGAIAAGVAPPSSCMHYKIVYV